MSYVSIAEKTNVRPRRTQSLDGNYSPRPKYRADLIPSEELGAIVHLKRRSILRALHAKIEVESLKELWFLDLTVLSWGIRDHTQRGTERSTDATRRLPATRRYQIPDRSPSILLAEFHPSALTVLAFWRSQLLLEETLPGRTFCSMEI